MCWLRRFVVCVERLQGSLRDATRENERKQIVEGYVSTDCIEKLSSVHSRAFPSTTTRLSICSTKYFKFVANTIHSSTNFYSEKFNREDVEAMLTLRPNGSYLLRPSSVNKHDMVLSVNQDSRIQHHLIVVFGTFRGAMLHGIHRNTLASLLLDLTSLQLIDPMDRAVKLQVTLFIYLFFVASSLSALSCPKDGYNAAMKDVTDAISEKKRKPKRALGDANLLHKACRWGLVEQVNRARIFCKLSSLCVCVCVCI